MELLTGRGAAIVLIAKDPHTRPAKTRLTADLEPAAVRDLACAMLLDTIDAMRGCGADRRVIVLDGDPTPWAMPGFEVLSQRGAGLDERLAAAFADVAGAAYLIGADTPQVTPELLDRGIAALTDDDAIPIGPATDGGYWSIGMRRPRRDLFTGVPMSTDRTYAATTARIRAAGCRTCVQPELRDVDHLDDLRAVAAECPPGSRTRALAGALGLAAADA